MVHIISLYIYTYIYVYRHTCTCIKIAISILHYNWQSLNNVDTRF